MTHLRTAIRQRIETVLGAISGVTIESGRVQAWVLGELPGINILTPSEAVVPDDKGSVGLRTLTVSIVATEPAGADDALDGLCLDVESLLETDWQSLTAGALGTMLFDWQLAKTEVDLSTEADTTVGTATLTFNAKYLATAGSPSS